MLRLGGLSRSLAIVLGFVVLTSLPNRSIPRAGVVQAAEAVTLDRASREYKAPDQIVWKGTASGSQSANLLGDPTKPGLYVQLLQRPADNWSKPHSHNHDRVITVLEGTFWIGTGPDFDKEKTVPMQKGSVVRDYANQMHYDGTKADGVVLEIVGIVPATATN